MTWLYVFGWAVGARLTHTLLLRAMSCEGGGCPNYVHWTEDGSYYLGRCSTCVGRRLMAVFWPVVLSFWTVVGCAYLAWVSTSWLLFGRVVDGSQPSR